MKTDTKNLLKNLTPEQTMAIITDLVTKSNQPIVMPNGENYINKTAAEYCFMMGMDPQTRANVPLSKAYGDAYPQAVSKAIGDFTGANAYLASLTTWNRNDLLTGARAKEFWDLIFNFSSDFVKKITFKTGDQLTYPLDIWASIEENLISSLRAGAQPTDAQIKEQVAVIGKELFGQHVEMQFNLPELDIINNLYNPNFEKELVARIMVGFSNDLLRLWTKGTSDDYSSISFATFTRTDMYKLGIGWLKILQDGNGSWTNSNQNAIVIGALGDKVTANKIAVDAIGWVNKYTGNFATVDGWVGVTSTVTAEAGPVLKILNAGYARKDGIKVPNNSDCIFTFEGTGDHVDSSIYGAVYGEDGTLLGSSAVHTGDVIATTHTIKFFSGTNSYVQLRIVQGAAQFADITNAPTVTAELVSRTGDDIIAIMDLMITNQPKQYKMKGKTTFVMGLTDVEKYADAKGESVRIVSGVPVGINTTIRDQWMVEGTIPRHKGYAVEYHPFMDSIDESPTYGGVTLYGSILFCDLKDLWAYGVGRIKKSREYKARMTGGGAGVELTNHLYTDAQVAPNERFGIAFQGATVETIVLMQDTKLKSTQCVTTTTTSAAGFAAYCDTKDARMFATLTSNVADIATLALAEAGVIAGDVWEIENGVQEGTAIGQSFLTAAAHSFRAFKTIAGSEVLVKSALTACTFA
jgi:hypothetical protein